MRNLIMDRRSLLLTLFFCIILCNVESRLTGEKIVGGDFAEENQIPYIVSVHFNGKHTCGGTIVDKRHIITGAHCVITDKHGFPEPRYSIKAGILYAHDETGVNIDVDKIYIPRKYYFENRNLTHNKFRDIAVMRLAKSLRLGLHSKLRKVDLPKVKSIVDEKKIYPMYANEMAMVSGFGAEKVTTKYDYGERKIVEDVGIPELKLKYAYAKVLSNADCKKYYADVIMAKNRTVVQPLHICARLEQRSSTPEGVCSGDSGGPLVYDNTLIGIVSRSPINCTEAVKPARYVRVTMVMDFIKDAIADKVDLENMKVAEWNDEEDGYVELE